MGIPETLNALAAKLSDLYREVVTTSVRFDELQRSTDKVLTRVEASVEQLATRVAAIHDEHVREKAALEAQIATLQAQLTVLSEQALHAVVREVAREAVSGVVREQLAAKSEIAEESRSATGTPNFGVKLMRPGFGPAAELPTSSPA